MASGTFGLGLKSHRKTDDDGLGGRPLARSLLVILEIQTSSGQNDVNLSLLSILLGGRDKWLLRVFNLRGWLLEAKARMLFGPATAAVLYAGEGERDRLLYINSKEAERTGSLVCARKRDLEGTVGMEAEAYPLSRFVPAEYKLVALFIAMIRTSLSNPLPSSFTNLE
ncbi:hypothetical protein F4818DRAFT_438597 [Hypoxylon cercidicola]|nr:hypothetical protein F4818DRAFT_438597 [Hypoxylon cercidicola]